MKTINNFKDLVGKTISFIDLGVMEEGVTITTEDGYILMGIMYSINDPEHGDEMGIRVLTEPDITDCIEGNYFLREELGKLGIFDIEEYEERQRVIRKRVKDMLKEAEESDELQEYERLKAKYEK